MKYHIIDILYCLNSRMMRMHLAEIVCFLKILATVNTGRELTTE